MLIIMTNEAVYVSVRAM